MKTLRDHLRDLELLENEAAEKAGMVFLLLDEKKLMGKGSHKYISEYVARLETAIAPEVIRAAKLGLELNKEVLK